MTKFITLFVVLISLASHARNTPVLKVGDVLLQPLKCWACTLIEEEEETIYSHIGVVVAVSPEVLVAEAFGSVKKVPLSEFDQKTEPGQELMVLRFRRDDLVEDLQLMAPEVLTTFSKEFEGAKYDHDFLWNNFDEDGNEKFYCSELVTKMFQALVGVEVGVKRMHFERNRDQWRTFFRGNIPDGKWGNSPGDFQRSELFYEVGEL